MPLIVASIDRRHKWLISTWPHSTRKIALESTEPTEDDTRHSWIPVFRGPSAAASQSLGRPLALAAILRQGGEVRFKQKYRSMEDYSQTNYTKSIGQPLALLPILDCYVDLVLKRRKRISSD